MVVIFLHFLLSDAGYTHSSVVSGRPKLIHFSASCGGLPEVTYINS